MTENSILCAVFMIIVLLIIAKKAHADISEPKSRRDCLWLIAAIAVYVLTDTLFTVYYITTYQVSVFRFIVFVFYITYVGVPFIWHMFMRNFVNITHKKSIIYLEYIPIVLMLGIVCCSVPNGILYSVNDLGEYARGPWYNAFVVINLFYYAESLVDALVILLRKRHGKEPYLLSSVIISCIPLLAAYMNSFVIPFGVIFPLQPFSLVIVALLAYLFIADRETRKNQVKYQEELQEALNQAQTATEEAIKAGKVKSDFLANMSHDIRTPLNAILGFSKIIEDNPSDEAVVKNAIAKVQISGDVLLDLVNDILDINRIENNKMHLELASTNLMELGEDIEAIFSNGMQRAGIHFTVSVKLDTPVVMCDAGKLREILTNLLGNAQKFTKAGGNVALAIEENAQHTYCFTVKDTGIGIETEFQGRMFEAFERERTSTDSNKTGTGLGLAIVKGLVELMDGKIEVESEQGKGTEIRVELSLVPSDVTPEAAKKAPSADKPKALDGIHILLVEDNELNREIADTLLENLGAYVTNAVNGEEAVETFNKSKSGTYDIILMDIMMPVMDGLTAAKTIRAQEHPDAKKIPIFAMTANAFAEDITKSHEAGMNEHLSKPLNVDMLVNAIQRYMC